MADTEPTVRKHVVVEAPIEHAFSVFTGRFGDFKPPEHNMLGAPISATVFEPRHLDRHGPGWGELTDGVAGPQGWPLYLDRYSDLIKGGH